MVGAFPALDLVFVESGGDNLAATFSPELADLTIYVIDVSAGDKIPRKGGPGITRSDLLVINKIDLAPLVGADLGVMERDAKRMRGERPFVFTNIKKAPGSRRHRRLHRQNGRAARLAGPRTARQPITYRFCRAGRIRTCDARTRNASKSGKTLGVTPPCAAARDGRRKRIAVAPTARR